MLNPANVAKDEAADSKMPSSKSDLHESLPFNRTYFGLGILGGLKVSPMCLGSRHLSTKSGEYDDIPLLNEGESRDILRAYMELGGNFVDTSVYAALSQRFIGGFIKEMNCREDLVVGTKAMGKYNPDEPNVSGCGRKSINRALNRSLDRLKTDYVDLLWIDSWDKVTPARELMRTLNGLVNSGKVLHLGFANMPSWYVAQCHQLAVTLGYETISVISADYNLCQREAELEYFDFCRQTGISFMPTAPLAEGFLAGHQHYMKEEHDLARVEKQTHILHYLQNLSKEINKPASQIALSWALKRPTVSSVLMTPFSVNQMKSNVQALDIELTREQLKELDYASLPKSVVEMHKVSQLPSWWMQ